MTMLFCLIVLTSLWCIGIKIVTHPGMALEKLGRWAAEKVANGSKIFEPLLVCPFCMPSIHSLFGYGFAVGMGMIDKFEWKLVVMYPLVVCGASVLTGVVWMCIELLIKISSDGKK